jgi:hypothetical protein
MEDLAPPSGASDSMCQSGVADQEMSNVKTEMTNEIEMSNVSRFADLAFDIDLTFEL